MEGLRNFNKVLLVGRLTHSPELRYTPKGSPVTRFNLAVNQKRNKKDETLFIDVVAWNKLAELCSQLLVKGRRVYVEGRIQYREYVGNDEVKKQVSEIVIEDMTILDSRRTDGGTDQGASLDQTESVQDDDIQFDIEEQESKKEAKSTKEDQKNLDNDSENEEEMPF